jgi:hypothetical protein
MCLAFAFKFGTGHQTDNLCDLSLCGKWFEFSLSQFSVTFITKAEHLTSENKFCRIYIITYRFMSNTSCQYSLPHAHISTPWHLALSSERT